MRRFAWLFCLLPLVSMAGCALEDGLGDHEEIVVASYADLQPASEWVYDDAYSSDSITVTYEGVQSVVGYTNPVHVWNVDGSDRFYFSEDLSSRLNLVGTDDSGRYDDALPLLRDDFTIGKTYGPYTTDDNDCDVYVTYHRADISVPYDDFDSTVLTTVTTRCTGELPKTQKFWFAKNTGLVKWLDDGDHLWELDDRIY